MSQIKKNKIRVKMSAYMQDNSLFHSEIVFFENVEHVFRTANLLLSQEKTLKSVSMLVYLKNDFVKYTITRPIYCPPKDCVLLAVCEKYLYTFFLSKPNYFKYNFYGKRH